MIKVLADEQASATDEQLVNSCRRGNQDSFRYLYRRYQQRVRSTLYQLCGEEMLEDLVQEVFLRVWKALPTLRNGNQFSTWLYRISWNVATDQRRSFAKIRQQKESYEENERVHLQNHLSSSHLLDLHYQDLVQKSLKSLPWEQRIVVILHDLEDLPQKEIADILSIPLGTVKSRLFHARHAIRQFLNQQGVSL